MARDFTNIAYLKTGNTRQQQAHARLSELEIFDTLRHYHPILTGSIPLGIDLPDSDLDIICQCAHHREFSETLHTLYSGQQDFDLRTRLWNGLQSTVATFRFAGSVIEIFGQQLPTEKQHAYQHLIIEYKLLNAHGPAFKKEIMKLRRAGYKTEPAFAQLLGLDGDPYEALLKIQI